MRQMLSRTAIAIALATLSWLPTSAKTVKECNAEYSANKAAIKADQKKADFITACRAGTETIPGAAAAPAAPAAPPPVQTAAPSAPVAPTAPAALPKPAVRVTRTAPPASTTATTGANQFAAEAQAAGRCPGATVVWLNIKSDVYHFAGTKNYGTTKDGAYMCESDALAAGDRASKKEKHP